MPAVASRQSGLRSRCLVGATLLVVLLATLLAFAPTLDGQFVNWDDDKSVIGNPGIRGLGASQLRWMLGATLLGHYAPLTWLSFAVTYVLAGLDPRAYHAGNLALHAINAGLFVLVARRLLAAAFDEPPRDRDLIAGAAVAALAWSAHPLRAENVGWISDRGDVLCGTFYLLAVLGYLRARSTGESPRWGWAGLGSLAAYAAALLSKEIAITLPIALVLIDAYPLRRLGLGWRRLLAEKTPYVILALGGAASAMIARSSIGGWTPYAQHGVGARLGFATFSFAFYPWKTLWPSGLSPLYAVPESGHLPWWLFAGAAIGVAAITAAVIGLRHRYPAALVVWAYAVITIAPVSGVAHAGAQLAADRYSYLPGLGFALVLGGGVVCLLQRPPGGRVIGRAAMLVAVMLVLVVWGALAWRQTGYWRSAVAMWQRAVAVDPTCAMCNGKLGEALLTANRPSDAEAPLRVAMLRSPASVTPRLNLAISLAMQGRDAEAEAGFEDARRLAPDSGAVAGNLAVLYIRQGRVADAVELLTSVGHGLVDQRRADEAIGMLERAVALDPRSTEARLWLLRAYQERGKARRTH
jgi:protein O-mannosyl-transferase